MKKILGIVLSVMVAGQLLAGGIAFMAAGVFLRGLCLAMRALAGVSICNIFSRNMNTPITTRARAKR